MLIPDEKFKAARPKVKNHHLSVAFLGTSNDVPSPLALRDLRQAVQEMAREIGAPIRGKANGLAIFDAGLDGVAVADLIDGVGTLQVRYMVEKRFGFGNQRRSVAEVSVNYKHGFTPHMTREYLEREDDFYATLDPSLIDNLEFTFDAIGLWHGDDERYEISL